MRRAIVLIFALGFLAGAAGVEFSERLAKFHQHYDAFIRSYLGCPKEARLIDECKGVVPIFPYGEFNKAAHDGRELWCFDKDK